MEAEGLAQLGITDVAGDDVVYAAITLQSQQLRGRANHAPPVEKRNVGELDVAFFEDVGRIVEETRVARDVGRALARDLRVGALGIVGVVEAVTALPAQTIKRIHGQQLDVITDLPTGQREQRLEAVRRSDDGGPGVESEALVPVDVGAAARKIPLLDQQRRNARRLQANGQGQPPEAAADDGCPAAAHRPAPGTPSAMAGRRRRTLASERHPSARCTGTGGDPLSRRMRSVRLRRPA